MDSPPKMPRQSRGGGNGARRPMLGRSATNEPPKMSHKHNEAEERLTPPLEIFVRELLPSCEGGSLEVSSSALTEVTMDASFCIANGSHFFDETDGNFSVTSSVSSLVDVTTPLTRSASGDAGAGGWRRLPPPRRTSSRRRRPRHRKGVMRWASMPNSSLRGTKGDGGEGGTGNDTKHSPRLPKRRGSNPSIVSDDDDEDDVVVTNKEIPRLPMRKKSSTSLFNVAVNNSSSVNNNNPTTTTTVVSATPSEAGTEEVVVSAHAA